MRGADPGTLRSLAGATAHNLRSRRRRSIIGDQVRNWRFAAADELPVLPLPDIFDGIEHIRCGATAVNRHHFELPYGERFALDTVIRYLGASQVFEFGTYRGATTRLLAEAVGADGEIHTIDLPAPIGVAADDDVIGSDLRAAPIDGGGKVVQHRIDSAAFDFEPFAGRFDVVFIDASHKREDVLRDSQHAFEIVRPGGVVVWDDYHSAQPEVVAAINELAQSRVLTRVAWTRLVIWKPDLDARVDAARS